MEFWLFLLCMEKGATNEGHIELIFIVLCSAGCGGGQGKYSSSEDALYVINQDQLDATSKCLLIFKIS
jgi:hypothetical protein